MFMSLAVASARSMSSMEKKTLSFCIPSLDVLVCTAASDWVFGNIQNLHCFCQIKDAEIRKLIAMDQGISPIQSIRCVVCDDTTPLCRRPFLLHEDAPLRILRGMP